MANNSLTLLNVPMAKLCGYAVPCTKSGIYLFCSVSAQSLSQEEILPLDPFPDCLLLLAVVICSTGSSLLEDSYLPTHKYAALAPCLSLPTRLMEEIEY